MDKRIGVNKARAAVAEAVLVFTADRAGFDAGLQGLLKTMPKTTILWVAYPKLTSKLVADLSRDVIHALAPKYGLDTVSQIAIDDDWSALGGSSGSGKSDREEIRGARSSRAPK